MKKAISLLLILSLALLIGCADNGTSSREPDLPTGEIGVPSRDPIRPPDGSGMAKSLYNALEKALTENPALTAEELAAHLATRLPYTGASMAVEPGYLTGFDNAEITDFSEGAQFGPMISTQPMIGYVFKLDAKTDRDAFIAVLEENANLRWNVCTSANRAVAAAYGDFVLFVMCP